jgi:hypothetical protein
MYDTIKWALSQHVEDNEKVVLVAMAWAFDDENIQQLMLTNIAHICKFPPIKTKGILGSLIEKRYVMLESCDATDPNSQDQFFLNLIL